MSNNQENGQALVWGKSQNGTHNVSTLADKSNKFHVLLGAMKLTWYVYYKEDPYICISIEALSLVTELDPLPVSWSPAPGPRS